MGSDFWVGLIFILVVVVVFALFVMSNFGKAFIGANLGIAGIAGIVMGFDSEYHPILIPIGIACILLAVWLLDRMDGDSRDPFR